MGVSHSTDVEQAEAAKVAESFLLAFQSHYIAVYTTIVVGRRSACGLLVNKNNNNATSTSTSSSSSQMKSDASLSESSDTKPQFAATTTSVKSSSNPQKEEDLTSSMATARGTQMFASMMNKNSQQQSENSSNTNPNKSNLSSNNTNNTSTTNVASPNLLAGVPLDIGGQCISLNLPYDSRNFWVKKKETSSKVGVQRKNKNKKLADEKAAAAAAAAKSSSADGEDNDDTNQLSATTVIIHPLSVCPDPLEIAISPNILVSCRNRGMLLHLSQYMKQFTASYVALQRDWNASLWHWEEEFRGGEQPKDRIDMSLYADGGIFDSASAAAEQRMRESTSLMQISWESAPESEIYPLRTVELYERRHRTAGNQLILQFGARTQYWKHWVRRLEIAAANASPYRIEDDVAHAMAFRAAIDRAWNDVWRIYKPFQQQQNNTNNTNNSGAAQSSSANSMYFHSSSVFSDATGSSSSTGFGGGGSSRNFGTDDESHNDNKQIKSFTDLVRQAKIQAEKEKLQEQEQQENRNNNDNNQENENENTEDQDQEEEDDEVFKYIQSDCPPFPRHGGGELNALTTSLFHLLRATVVTKFISQKAGEVAEANKKQKELMKERERERIAQEDAQRKRVMEAHASMLGGGSNNTNTKNISSFDDDDDNNQNLEDEDDEDEFAATAREFISKSKSKRGFDSDSDEDENTTSSSTTVSKKKKTQQQHNNKKRKSSSSSSPSRNKTSTSPIINIPTNNITSIVSSSPTSPIITTSSKSRQNNNDFDEDQNDPDNINNENNQEDATNNNMMLNERRRKADSAWTSLKPYLESLEKVALEQSQKGVSISLNTTMELVKKRNIRLDCATPNELMDASQAWRTIQEKASNALGRCPFLSTVSELLKEVLSKSLNEISKQILLVNNNNNNSSSKKDNDKNAETTSSSLFIFPTTIVGANEENRNESFTIALIKRFSDAFKTLPNSLEDAISQAMEYSASANFNSKNGDFANENASFSPTTAATGTTTTTTETSPPSSPTTTTTTTKKTSESTNTTNTSSSSSSSTVSSTARRGSLLYAIMRRGFPKSFTEAQEFLLSPETCQLIESLQFTLHSYFQDRASEFLISDSKCRATVSEWAHVREHPYLAFSCMGRVVRLHSLLFSDSCYTYDLLTLPGSKSSSATTNDNASFSQKSADNVTTTTTATNIESPDSNNKNAATPTNSDSQQKHRQSYAHSRTSQLQHYLGKEQSATQVKTRLENTRERHVREAVAQVLFSVTSVFWEGTVVRWLKRFNADHIAHFGEKPFMLEAIEGEKLDHGYVLEDIAFEELLQMCRETVSMNLIETL